MTNFESGENRIEGKTYSLFGNSDSTNAYYHLISSLADKIFENYPDISSAIEIITRYSSKKRYLRKILKTPVPGELISDWINLIDPELKQYTQKAEDHLKGLPLTKTFDRGLATTREQYHLFMLEIEMTNRLNSVLFKNSERKIALMPYCLQDFSVSCKAAKKGFDYQCKSCSSLCFHRATTCRTEPGRVGEVGRCLDELKQQGFAGNISIEYEYNWTSSVPEIKKCIDFVRDYKGAAPKAQAPKEKGGRISG